MNRVEVNEVLTYQIECWERVRKTATKILDLLPETDELCAHQSSVGTWIDYHGIRCYIDPRCNLFVDGYYKQSVEDAAKAILGLARKKELPE